MNELVRVTDNRELVVSLEDVASATDNQVSSIIALIQKYSDTFDVQIPKGSYKDLKSLCLTEKDTYKLLVLMGNSKKVLEFKIALVDEFFRMREFLRNGLVINDELKKHIEQFIPKGGYLEENAKGELKTKPVRGYFRVDKIGAYATLLNKKYQLQKRVNSLLREEYELEIKMVEIELAEIDKENVA